MDESDLAETAKRLDARFVLSGRVDGSVRATAIRLRLTDADELLQLWSGRYEVGKTDSLADVQRRIARHVVSNVAGDTGIVKRTLRENLVGRSLSSMSAYEAVLRSIHCANLFTREAASEARQALEFAVHSDPQYALAWAHLGVLLLDDETFGFDEVEDASARGARCIDRAVVLDPECQFSRYAQAYARCVQGDPTGTTEAARHVVGLNPNHAYMVGCAAFFLAMAGEFEESREAMACAKPLLPRYPDWWHLAPYLESLVSGDYGAALAQANRIGTTNLHWSGLTRASALGYLGRQREARSAFDEARQVTPDLHTRPLHYVSRLIANPRHAQIVVQGLPHSEVETRESAT